MPKVGVTGHNIVNAANYAYSANPVSATYTSASTL